ncbi:ribose transport system substrate-binding protein [Microbacterium sp. BE35]|uniref:substrate-binding domain-containing protein n=1 Tax=Microbacterium sp. BE35 TaxID=2817773 RepID=UPI002861B1DE|nr:substrate-binding domain-containing protein [Microbacterium sp. BE35]MDR7188206.1 ribose transport system substrate-binding protein [Microbacterium sp. BE35]
MNGTRIAALTLALASVVALAGCTTSSQAADDKPTEDYYADFVPPTLEPEAGSDEVVDTSKFVKPEGEPLVIGYADASLSNSWRVMTKAETEYAISQIPDAELVYTNANDSTPKQIADMDDLITQQVDAIILSATDVKALCPSIAKAEAAGIPVVIQEREVDCDDYTTFVSLNAPELGAYQMEYVAQRLGGKGKIAIVSGIPGTGHTVAVETAYKKVLENYPDIEVVDTQYAEYDATKGRQMTAAILTAHPDLDAVLGISGNLGIGVFQGVQDAGLVDQMKAWVGDDANGWMLIHKNNNLPSMTVPYPVSIGAVAVDTAAKILRGEEVMKTTEVARWAAPEDFSANISDYANDDRPDEWWYNDMPCEFDPFCKS